MTTIVLTVGLGTVVFASTNGDDLFLLLPFVLIGLGLFILSRSLPLVR